MRWLWQELLPFVWYLALPQGAQMHPEGPGGLSGPGK